MDKSFIFFMIYTEFSMYYMKLKKRIIKLNILYKRIVIKQQKLKGFIIWMDGWIEERYEGILHYICTVMLLKLDFENI
jgi:hypothetical protein